MAWPLRLDRPPRSDANVNYDAIFVCQDGMRLATARVRCYRFAEQLERLGLKTRVLSFVDHLGAPDQGGGPIDYISDQEKLRLNAVAMNELLRYPDAVLFMQKTGYHFPAVLGAASANGNPVIFDYDDYDFLVNGWPELSQTMPQFRPEQAFKLAAQTAAAITVSSARLQEIVAGHGFSAHLVPTGPDLERFHPCEPLLPPDPEGRVRLWWGGDLWGETIVRNLLRVMESLNALPEDLRRKVQVVMCGFGRLYASFTAAISTRFQDRFDIKIMGAVAPDDMPALLSSIDIGLVPLNPAWLFDQCKSPTKMFELMALSKPVVAERCGEPERVITDGVNGFLAGTNEEWTARLGQLVGSEMLRWLIGTNARRTIEQKYALQTVMPTLKSIIDTVRRSSVPDPLETAAR
jgi:glycosyltransferase involved in cell wall biosynthesis